VAFAAEVLLTLGTAGVGAVRMYVSLVGDCKRPDGRPTLHGRRTAYGYVVDERGIGPVLIT
jgi:hypothetical protein